MPSTVKPLYSASAAVTCTLASLASDTSLLAGRSSILVDNTGTLAVDYLLSGHVKAGTTPTAGQVEFHAIGMADDTTWPDVLDGTDSAKTLTSSAIKGAITGTAKIILTDTTTGRVYPFGPLSVAQLFGGLLPKKFVVFVVHSMVAALDATAANHAISITPVQLQIV